MVGQLPPRQQEPSSQKLIHLQLSHPSTLKLQHQFVFTSRATSLTNSIRLCPNYLLYLFSSCHLCRTSSQGRKDQVHRRNLSFLSPSELLSQNLKKTSLQAEPRQEIHRLTFSPHLQPFQIKEYQVVDLLVPGLKDEVMSIKPVQKQTRAGQRTRFKAFVAIGDGNGHLGLGVKCAKEVATAIRAAIILAKLSLIPVRRGYWGNALGEPHTVPVTVSGKVASVMCRLVPAPRGTGIVAAPASKRLLQLAGVEDCYTQSR